MEQAVATRSTRLGEKLRREGSGTDHVTMTSEHDRGTPGRSVSTTVTLAEATIDTLVLVKAATLGARKVWRDGYSYSKAGIVTVDLVPFASCQRALPGMDLGEREARASLMAALDAYNRRSDASRWWRAWRASCRGSTCGRRAYHPIRRVARGAGGMMPVAGRLNPIRKARGSAPTFPPSTA